MQEAERRIIWCQGDWSHSPCPLRASGTKPALWSATGGDIYSHFYRLWVASHSNATWEFLGLISSCYHVMIHAYSQLTSTPNYKDYVINKKMLISPIWAKSLYKDHIGYTLLLRIFNADLNPLTWKIQPWSNFYTWPFLLILIQILQVPDRETCSQPVLKTKC